MRRVSVFEEMELLFNRITKVIDSGCVLCLGVVLEGDGDCVGC